eukprot:Seg5617.1 transcript_id=Seg5617.1/GoldUCD/mRNA.D3Y31 product="hypothetical protein" protein_id=Seg5617.1/GoldUCD/D3Y31
MVGASADAEISRPRLGEGIRKKGDKVLDGVKQPIATSAHKIPANHAEYFYGHSHRNTSKEGEDCTKEKEPNVATIDIDTESASFASANNGKANATCDDNNQPDRNRCGHPAPPISEIDSSSTANVEGNVMNKKQPAAENDAGESLVVPKSSTTAAIPDKLVYLLERASHGYVSESEDDNLSNTDVESIISDEFESDVELL